MPIGVANRKDMKHHARFVKRIAAGLVLALPLTLAAPALAEFVDMIGHWSAEAVGALSARGIVTGVTLQRFDPNAPLTRAQLARLLTDAVGADGAARLLVGRDTRFLDTPGTHWAAGYVEALAERGIMSGYPGALFQPEQPVTRMELAAVLTGASDSGSELPALRYTPLPYVDRDDVPDWAHAAVAYVSRRRYMVGYDDGTFRPGQITTRAEAASTIMHFLTLRGDLWTASGTLMSWDPVAGTGMLRLPAGRVRRIALYPDALVYRQGRTSPAALLQPLDQVWVIERQGKVSYLSARYEDQFCEQPIAQKPGVWSCSGSADLQLRPDTMLFVNGKPAAEPELKGARLAYVALDSQTGAARAVDAIVPTLNGTVRMVTDSVIVMQGQNGTVALTFGADSQFFRRDQRMEALSLKVGDEINVVTEKGAVKFAVVSPS